MKAMMFSLAVATAFLLTSFNLFAQDQAPEPEYHAGDFWQFRVTEKNFTTESTAALSGDYEVLNGGGKLIVQRPGGEQLEGVKEVGILFGLLKGRVNNEAQYLQFPLSVGKKWSVDYQGQLRGNARPIGRHAENSVTGVEEVTTEAGKFRSFKIERYDTGGGGRGLNAPIFVFTYHYSPETRSVVKYHYEARGQTGMSFGIRDIELIKFGSKLPK